MKKIQQMKISLYQRKGKGKYITLYAYVIIDGVRASSAISTGVRCLPQLWTGVKLKDKILQQQLDDFRTAILETYQSLKLHYVAVTPDMVIEHYRKEQTPLYSFVGFAEKLTAEKKPLGKYLKKFLSMKGTKNMSLSDVNNMAFAQRYKLFLEQSCKSSYARKCLAFMRFVIEKAIIDGMEKSNSFAHVVIKEKKKEILFLSEKEVLTIKEKNYRLQSLERTADLFVFQCFTGFSFIDLKNFSAKNIVEINGKQWIKYDRQKSSVSAVVPFFAEAREIWEKYKGILPVISNQKYNAHLKEIAQETGIKTVLTSHVARKTAGSLWLNKGLSYEVVAKMLGHANISTTQRYYAQVQHTRIADELGKLNIDF